jgi:hypothetical protein
VLYVDNNKIVSQMCIIPFSQVYRPLRTHTRVDLTVFFLRSFPAATTFHIDKYINSLTSISGGRRGVAPMSHRMSATHRQTGAFIAHNSAIQRQMHF